MSRIFIIGNKNLHNLDIFITKSLQSAKELISNTVNITFVDPQ